MTVENPQRVTRDGKIELYQREAIVLVPYPDGEDKETGAQKYSQAMGCQTNYSVDPPRPVRADDPPLELEEAVRWIDRAIADREATLNKWLTVLVTDGQFDALHDLFYQAGSGPTREVIAFYNAGRPHLAMCQLARYPFGANKVPTEGHAKRRLAEIAISHRGDYGDQTQVKVYDSDPHQSQPRIIDPSTLI